jgi:L-aspartate oxidase
MGAVPEPESWEATNVHAVASALVAAATLREETRGCHWREDFPSLDDRWRGHFVSRLEPDGSLSTEYEAIRGAVP